MTVVERLRVDDPLSLPDGDCEGVEEADPDSDAVGVIEFVGVEDRDLVVDGVSESEPVFDELAPDETLEVGVCDIELDILVVELGVIEGVGDDDDVILGVGEALEDRELDDDSVSAPETVFEEITAVVRLDEGVCVTERERLAGEPVEVSLGVGGRDKFGVPLTEPSSDFVSVVLAVAII